MNIPRILIIAGSDSSGGAGIQADIKTVSARGGYAMTAITALTAQNTLGVSAIHSVPAGFVAAQIAACVEDIGVDAIKTGMLHDAAVIAAVAEEIKRIGRHPELSGEGSLEIPARKGRVHNDNIPFVLDPVMVATSGARLLDEAALDVLMNKLMPLASVVTPNIPEAEMLSGMTIRSKEDMVAAAVAISFPGHPRAGGDLSAQDSRFRGNDTIKTAVLLKGGHLPGEVVSDLLLAEGKEYWFESPRIDTRHTHGTGCTLASALATELAKGKELVQAVDIARDYVHRAIQTAPGLGQGHGPLNHLG